MIGKWTRIIHNQLPDLGSTYNDDASRLIDGFLTAHAASTLKICPALSEALYVWKDSSSRTIGPLKKNTKTIFAETIANAAKDAHRLVKPKVLDAWLPVYEKCAAETGQSRNLHF